MDFMTPNVKVVAEQMFVALVGDALPEEVAVDEQASDELNAITFPAGTFAKE